MMNELKLFLFTTFLIFTIICCFFCIEAHLRYRNKAGIDQENTFFKHYKYFGQQITDQQGHLIAYELLLREFDPQTKQWQLPHNVANFPLSKAAFTIQQIMPTVLAETNLLAINMTVSQLIDFRSDYFFNWVQAIIGSQQLIIEIDINDIRQASWLHRKKLRQIIKHLHQEAIKVTIDGIDSSQATFSLLHPFLKHIDYLKFNIQHFEKSPSHWIDITLAQWQQEAQKYHVTPIINRIETAQHIWLADLLNINLRQGFSYGQPEPLRTLTSKKPAENDLLNCQLAEDSN